jgi:mannosyltransferase
VPVAVADRLAYQADPRSGGSPRAASVTAVATEADAVIGTGLRAGDISLALSQLLPPLIALGLGLWAIAVPSYWRDEAATVAAVSRPLASLPAMLGHVDAVHGTYYLVMWPLARLFGTGELLMRLPSAVATAIAAAVVAGIGRRLVSSWAGLAAGSLFAVLPMVSLYAQTARSYAMVIAAASVASWLLSGMLEHEPTRGSSQSWRFAAYAVSLTLLGALNIFGLLLIPAHGLTVAVHWQRGRDRRGARLLALGWLGCAGLAGALLSPLLVLGWRQRGQVAWLARGTLDSDIKALAGLTGSLLVSAIVVAIVSGALLIGIRCWPGPLAELTLPWLILPPTALLAVSMAHPVFTSRYVLLCLPALALLTGTALASFGKVIGPAGLALIMLAAWPVQQGQRAPAGHGENIREMDQIVSPQARPGDMLVYPNPNADVIGSAYPDGLARLPNAGVRQGPVSSGTLAGSLVSLAEIRQRLGHAKRVWVVEISKLTLDPVLLSVSGKPIGPVLTGLPFSEVRAWRCGTDSLVLYTRNPAPANSAKPAKKKAGKNQRAAR